MQCRWAVTVSCVWELGRDCVGSRAASITVRVLLTVGLGVSSIQKLVTLHVPLQLCAHFGFAFKLLFSMRPFPLGTTDSATTSSSVGRLSGLLAAWFDASSQWVPLPEWRTLAVLAEVCWRWRCFSRVGWCLVPEVEQKPGVFVSHISASISTVHFLLFS